MRKPLGYYKEDLTELTRSELKIYLKVLQDEESWTACLKYAVSIGDVVVNEEIKNIESMLNRNTITNN